MVDRWRTTSLALLTGILVIGAGGAAFAHDDEARDEHDRAKRTTAADPGRDALAVVPNGATPGEPGHGWRYFSDPAGRRAVAISPDGDYYFSRGKGLRLVARAQALS